MSGYKEISLELIRGGYDLHTHTAPSHAKRSLDDFELLREAESLGMAGVMIKSHYEPTEARASIVNMSMDTKTKAYGAIALNWPVGGLNPYAVESSLKLGAVLVWMPTKDTLNCLQHGKEPGDFFERPGITIWGENGEIKREVFEIMEVVRKYDAYLATGHLSPKESLALCKAGRKMGVNMVLTHPDWRGTIVPLELQLEIAHMDVLIEKVWLNIAESNTTAGKMAHSIKKIGADHVFIVTDRGQAGFEKPAQAMLLFIEALMKQGITSVEIKKMICDNPKRIVND